MPSHRHVAAGIHATPLIAAVVLMLRRAGVASARTSDPRPRPATRVAGVGPSIPSGLIGSVLQLVMRLLRLRSRKCPNCLKVSHLGRMHRPNHPREISIFTQHSCNPTFVQLTICQRSDRVMIGEKGRLKFLFATRPLIGRFSWFPPCHVLQKAFRVLSFSPCSSPHYSIFWMIVFTVSQACRALRRPA